MLAARSGAQSAFPLTDLSTDSESNCTKTQITETKKQNSDRTDVVYLWRKKRASTDDGFAFSHQKFEFALIRTGVLFALGKQQHK